MATVVPSDRIGAYRLVGPLGEGGMAVVHKALQPSLGRPVAIKALRKLYAADPRVSARFEREATSMATLEHTNIVHVYDYIRDEDQAYIIMEFVDGLDLDTLLRKSGPMPPPIAAIIAIQIIEGLEYAHARGIVHRDIKPSNILISKTGVAKIMDFGIARDSDRENLTQTGMTLGTPSYMAPEQIRGDRVDGRTDLFALGVVLYEMLMGDRPWFEDPERSVTVKVLDEAHPQVRLLRPDVPQKLERIIDQALQKSPDARFMSATDFREALEAYAARSVPSDRRAHLVTFLAQQSGAAKPPALAPAGAAAALDPSLQADARHLQRRRWPRTALGLSLSFLALLFAVALMSDDWWGLNLKFVSSSAQVEGLHVPVAATGFLKVVVRPWAEVIVDGTPHDTTPFAAPIALTPGTHKLGFRNPYFQPVDRVVHVQAGKTVLLSVVLSDRKSEEGHEDRGP